MVTMQKEKTSKFSDIIVYSSSVAGAILGVFYILILLASFDVIDLPLIVDTFSAFIGLAIFGFAMCMTVYPIRASLHKKFKWLSFLTIFSIILGSLATVEIIIVILVEFGKMASIPILTEFTNSVIILSVIVFTKWITASLHLFVDF